MHKHFLIFAFPLLAAIGMTGCDDVDCPFEEGCDTQEAGIVYDDSTMVAAQTQFRTVLLEEFTGHTCTVCPEGAAEVERLLSEYGDSIIAVGVHAGTFAEPEESGSKYTTDFRNSTSNAIFEFFDPPGNPMGMVSRIGPEGQKPMGKDGWEPSMVNNGILGQAATASMSLTTLWDDSTNTVGARTELTWLTDPPNSNYRVQFYLVESHIIDWQLDNGQDIEQYEHNHVLRGGMIGDWGTEVTVLTNGGSQRFFAEMALDAAWVKDNCEVVAFIYDTDSYEVYQAVHGYLPGHP